MSDARAKIQLARIQDDVWLWGTLVQGLMQESVGEGMKAALSGAMRGTPGGKVKGRAAELIVENLDRLTQIDLPAATDAAVTAAIYSPPDSKIRARATEFVVTNLERLAGIDAKLAATNLQFALGWTAPGSDAAIEAARIWSNLSVSHPAAERENPLHERDILGEDRNMAGSIRTA